MRLLLILVFAFMISYGNVFCGNLSKQNSYDR